MNRTLFHHIVTTCLLASTLGLVSCATSPLPSRVDRMEEPRRAAQVVQYREQELATLRADMAATLIAAAKKEAELQELRHLVQQLRLENTEFRQASLELRDQAEQRQRDLEKAQEEQARQAHAHSTQDLNVLKDTVVTLAQELGQLRQDLAKPVAKERVKSSNSGSSESSESGLHEPRSHPPQRMRAARQHASASSAISPMALTVTDASVPDAPSTVTVQPGDTLASLAKRHRTTVEILRTLNVLTGDTVIVGRELVLPTSQQP